MIKSTNLIWLPVPAWYLAHLVGFDDLPGLIRFSWGSETVYIGMETRSLKHCRRFVTKGGTGRKHAAGKLIWANRRELTLEVAVVDASPLQIERLRNALINDLKPAFNFEDHDDEPLLAAMAGYDRRRRSDG